MKVRQYRLRRSVEDGHYEEKICWLDRLNLKIGDKVTLEDYPDWMWWDVTEVFQLVNESHYVTFTRPVPEKEYSSCDWIPM